MDIELITIGEELLIGQVIDTNSAWMAQRLNEAGLKIKRIVSISDDNSAIIAALEDAGKAAKLVITTGGLGPTRDDTTKEAICSFLNTKLVMHNQTKLHIKEMLQNRGIRINQRNYDQALVPEAAMILENKVGTAPGLWAEKNGVIYIHLPGVPFEMKHIIEEKVLPIMRQKFRLPPVLHRVIMFQGIAESSLAELIEDWENNLPNEISVAYLPAPGILKLRLSILPKTLEEGLERLENAIGNLIPIAGKYIFSTEESTLEEVLGKALLAENKTIGTAESCTGGGIAARLTSVPGSSAYFLGSIVAYDNKVKKELLGVTAETLNIDGAVSKSAVEQMARGVCDKLKCDIGIAVSGIAGPDGGTKEKPVGTIWIACTNGLKMTSRKYTFGNDRQRNIERSIQAALRMAHRMIME